MDDSGDPCRNHDSVYAIYEVIYELGPRERETGDR